MGTVWHNATSDGVQTGDPGALGAVVELFRSPNAIVGDSDDVSLGTRITPANGSYVFANVDAGNSYFVTARPSRTGFIDTVA